MRRTTPIPDTITVHVPFRLVKRGGRKEIVLPEGAQLRRTADDTLVKALARAFRAAANALRHVARKRRERASHSKRLAKSLIRCRGLA